MIDVVRTETVQSFGSEEDGLDTTAYINAMYHNIRMAVMMTAKDFPVKNGQLCIDTTIIMEALCEVAALMICDSPVFERDEAFLNEVGEFAKKKLVTGITNFREKEKKTPGYINNCLFAGLQAEDGGPLYLQGILVAPN